MLSGAFSRFGAVGGAGIGFAIGHGVSPAISPLVQDLANEAWQAHAVKPLPLGLAAQLVAEGLWPLAEGAAEAEMTGYSGDRFAAAVEQARTGPTLEQAYQGVRRGLLDGADLTRALEQAGVRDEWRPFLRELVARVLTGEQAAGMVARGILGPGAGQAIADANGIAAADFARMVEAEQHAPGLAELLQLWNRGELDEAEVEAGLERQGVAPEYREAVKALRDYLPPVSDQVTFAVRDVYSPDVRATYRLAEDFPAEFATAARRLGLSTEDAERYWMAHWVLPSIEQGFRMFHRGIISRAELETLLRTKDVMPYWRDRVIEMNYLVPGRVDLRRMFAAGIIDRAGLVKGYTDLGYAPEVAEQQAEFAEALVADAATRGSVVPAYRRRVISATAREFVAGQISEAEARQVLGALDLPATTIARLLPLWTLERGVSRRELTVAELVKAYKAEVIDEATALAELRERGFTADDAQIRLDAEGGDVDDDEPAA